MPELTPINLRDANQQFSELVRRIEATGQGYLVLRHGKPVARLVPVEEQQSRLTPEQEAALERILGTSWPLEIDHLDRDELYDKGGGG